MGHSDHEKSRKEKRSLTADVKSFLLYCLFFFKDKNEMLVVIEGIELGGC